MIKRNTVQISFIVIPFRYTLIRWFGCPTFHMLPMNQWLKVIFRIRLIEITRLWVLRGARPVHLTYGAPVITKITSSHAVFRTGLLIPYLPKLSLNMRLAVAEMVRTTLG